MKFFSLLVVVAIVAAQAGCTHEQSSLSDAPGSQRSGTGPVRLTDENFEREVLKSPQPVLVDMWAKWCEPCVKMKPTIEELNEEFAGEAKVGELDVDANPFIAEKYAIERYPTLIIFHDGVEVERLVGVKTKEELADLLHSVINSSGGAG